MLHVYAKWYIYQLRWKPSDLQWWKLWARLASRDRTRAWAIRTGSIDQVPKTVCTKRYECRQASACPPYVGNNQKHASNCPKRNVLVVWTTRYSTPWSTRLRMVHKPGTVCSFFALLWLGGVWILYGAIFAIHASWRWAALIYPANLLTFFPTYIFPKRCPARLERKWSAT